MVKKVSGILLRESWKEFWRRQTIVITMDKLGVPRPIQDTIPWIRYIRDEYEKELEAQKAVDEALTTQVATPIGIPDYLAAPPELVSVYRKYACVCGDPLGCEWPQQTVQQDPKAKHCLKCDFPAALKESTLRERSDIRGSRGIYRINSWTGRRGMGRLYRGTLLAGDQPVVIKEYLLPNFYFNQEEAERRKLAFVSLAGVSLADGRVQDFRLERPWEAIADRNEERCYLVTRSNLDSAPTLRVYLAQRGSMTGGEVRQVLNQVLQTLEFLHGQKFRLPAGQVYQGLAHGNISLDTLLIVGSAADATSEIQDFSALPVTLWPVPLTSFFIHLCDLALWERLFYPSLSETVKASPAQDLIALGYVGFYLLAGRNVDPVTGQPLNPRDDRNWPPVNPALKEFILRLQQPDGFFESAEEARLALLKLPSEERQITPPVLQVEPDEENQKVKTPRILLLLLGTLGLVLLGVLVWSLLPKTQAGEIAQDDFMRCCIKEVPGVPGGNFTYTGTTGSTWTYVLTRTSQELNGQTLEGKLKERQPKLELKYKPELSPEEAIERVRSGSVDFAITSLVSGLPSDLNYKEVAYDALVVVVDFSYSKRENSLPTALKGQLTFEQLRQIYTGQINNWKQLGGPDLPVKLYIPAETEAVQIFEQRVLKDKQQIDVFRNLLKKDNQPADFVRTSPVNEITPLETEKMLRRVRQDFEENQPVGAIGFGPVSKIFGQCAVYPLALVDGNKQPVQALVQDNSQPIEPTTDLCNKKGSYRPDIQALKTGRYPLAYPIAVVYLRDNSRPPAGEKFADMLRTRESQRLLSKTGLVPLQPLPRY